ncbi:hypothetical protein B0H14DRAFT_2337137 [Mycena olivaceomarginata]|nr:hypothetical protein B0H14DRAFT_2337137 [Mycena olivaceomarginata]
MCYLAAYLLLQIGISGKTSPSAADIKKLIGTVGIETDDERLDKLISELKGKSIDELIAEGSSKLASIRGGGAAPAAGGAAPVCEEYGECEGMHPISYRTHALHQRLSLARIPHLASSESVPQPSHDSLSLSIVGAHPSTLGCPRASRTDPLSLRARCSPRAHHDILSQRSAD